MIYAYLRVSSTDQNLDRQYEAVMKRYPDLVKENIFTDKQSGKDFDRPEYQRLKSCLREGDLLIVKSIDRLGRKYKDIRREWEDITQNIKADIKVLDMPLLDTTLHKDLLGTFISDLILQILAYVAENERINIKQRQAEGIAAAKARGVKFGRPKKELPELEKILKKQKEGFISITQACKELGISRTQWYRLLNKIA
jgi:DNA invertase Pin-like site-specific DNA recombinase